MVITTSPGQFITSEVAKVGNRRSLRVSVCGQVKTTGRTFFFNFVQFWRGWADHAFDRQVEEEEEGLNNRDEGVGCCGVHMEF